MTYWWDTDKKGWRYGSTKPRRQTKARTEDERQAGYRKAIANAETEAEFDSKIVQLAKINGWRTYHTYDSRKSVEGWPDRVFTRRPEFFAAELKKEAGETSAAQDSWIDELRACGWEVYVWRPSDWDQVVERLTRLRG